MDKYKVWMMTPSSTFDGEAYIINIKKRPLYEAIIVLEGWAEKKFGEKPEKIEKLG